MEFNINHIQETSSSNTYLKELSVTTDCKEGTVIMADFQSDGRGQGQNRWYSDRATNLLTSILLNPGIDTEYFFFITVMTSLALIDILQKIGLNAFIKWPNDIYVNDQKIAGLLIENSLVETNITKSIIGIGLNINEKEFPEWIPNPTSIAKLMSRKFSTSEILDALLAKLEKRYAQVKDNSFEELLNAYNGKLYKKGALCNFMVGSKFFQARIIEVGPKGEFIISQESGSTQSFLFGEIKMRH